MTNKKLEKNEVAKFCGVTSETLRNWGKTQVQEGIKFYPPFGRHNLLKGAYLATYLYKYAESEEGAEHYNNAEFLNNNIKGAISTLEALKNPNLDKELKAKLLESAIGSLINIKEIAEFINNPKI